MREVRIARISQAPLDVAAHLAAVEDPRVGGVTSFIGTVRDHDPDASDAVVALEYSAHPDAEAALREIALTAIGSASAVVAVSHRVGRLQVGEAAVVIAVGAAHRGDAFAVCREVIEAIKRDLPVWKRQHAADGSAAWKGIGG
ncbi:molybdenum cofactor biosynthesis protein MoaE [Microbacterium sp. W1N]|uniref:molybdenum cofactor biosynthesis protein MoaE n=1 Tax=Microbacterium festucae TaxID=2977531 RepID=UPI0021C102BE|nr:molybdenum cofactor biosynthesis protein MoaE [Microbacterium festucae]MCT9820892.1 molybdenum cofactor biosynthesis protein MoaE [Microbacterium festucae]